MNYFINPVTGDYYKGDRAASFHIPVPERPSVDHRYIDGAWVFDRSACIARLNEEVAAVRYNKEVEGVNVGGVPVKTDRESQAQLNNAHSSFDNNYIADTDWKSDGVWAELVAADVAAIGNAVANHVRLCFKAERRVTETRIPTLSDMELQSANIQALFDEEHAALTAV